MTDDLDDDTETQKCARCETLMLIDDLSHHGEDYDLCPTCSAELNAIFHACEHDLEPDTIADEHGDPVRICRKCNSCVDVSWDDALC